MRPKRPLPRAEGSSHVGLTGPFDLESTLYSGQAFRWAAAEKGWHEGWVHNAPCRVRATRGRLEFEAGPETTPQLIAAYFRLDGSHERFLAEVLRDAAVAAALERFPGLRLLRQDPWEMMVSFVISQNSNEAKIRRTIEALCQIAGEPIERAGKARYRFPTPENLARLDEDRLRSTGMGYRARFVHAAADAVASGKLDPHRLGRLAYEEAFDRLMEIDGIGAKVADCILLYGCDQQLAFPSDVWVRRFLRETYIRRHKNPNHLKIREFAWKHFGPYAGYAQHYLFHYRRSVGTLANRS